MPPESSSKVHTEKIPYIVQFGGNGYFTWVGSEQNRDRSQIARGRREEDIRTEMGTEVALRRS